MDISDLGLLIDEINNDIRYLGSEKLLFAHRETNIVAYMLASLKPISLLPQCWIKEKSECIFATFGTDLIF